ncbi:iron ABC transporter permease [Pelagibius sp. Alg239-R121]|uniref:FecCD family ABC transporter permease n=1 Tax=Pelagibius sp. Alg239-R121 TaxID=2993448 RepID=UPI0024A66002|nr:iron ABC transporter permease [Pelagibius sp. Alg239-R121]
MALIGSETLTYVALVRRRSLILFSAAIALTLVVVIDILVGPAFLAFGDVVSALVLPASQVDPTVHVIVREIRLPMTLMALLVGASLGTAGALMQTILGNPLASPYTLGFSAAAGCGAALAILTGFELPVIPDFSIPVAACVGGALAACIVYGMARMRGMTSEVMILAGIATLFMFQSLQSLVQYMAAPEVLQEIVFWLFGSLVKASYLSVSITCGILLTVALLLIPDVWKLTALRLGDERAQSLGVAVERLRLKIFALIVLLTAGAVAFVGTIGFIGLVAPHIARMLVGEDQRVLLPMSAVTGAFVMASASVASKLISPGAIVPIGIVTAIIGVPFLFLLIARGRRRFW